jgi:hypothetical protein
MTDPPKKPLIPGRVMLIGEEAIPRDVILDLEEPHIQLFMREPDPRAWPPEMHPLISYLSASERVAYKTAAVLDKHSAALQPALERWAVSAWDDLVAEDSLKNEDPQLIINEVVNHVKNLLAALLETKK